MIEKIIIAALAFVIWMFSLVIVGQQAENRRIKEQYKILAGFVESIKESVEKHNNSEVNTEE